MEFKSASGQVDGASEGSISASIAVFDAIDSDGDVCKSTFFKDGQRLPMVWAHDWTKPIGLGTISVKHDQAVFNGELFLDTIDGKEAHTKIKRLGDTQQYSFGFVATDTERGQFQGKSVRFLKSGRIYEASPVLVGANERTSTLSIKSGFGGLFVPGAIENSFEDLADDISEAMVAQHLAPAGACVCTLATFAGYAYVSVDPDGNETPDFGEEPADDDTTYWRVEYALGPDGDPILSNPSQVEPNVVFTACDDMAGMTMASQSMKALAATQRLATRTGALAALRFKSGRVLSAANHAKLTDVHNGIAGHLAAMADVLKAHAPDMAPAPAEDAAKKALDRKALWAEHLRLEARMNGVAV